MELVALAMTLMSPLTRCWPPIAAACHLRHISTKVAKTSIKRQGRRRLTLQRFLPSKTTRISFCRVSKCETDFTLGNACQRIWQGPDFLVGAEAATVATLCQRRFELTRTQCGAATTGFLPAGLRLSGGPTAGHLLAGRDGAPWCRSGAGGRAALRRIRAAL